MERKAYEGNLKQLDEKGNGIAVIATLGVPDLDSDIVMPGALAGQTAPLLQSHQWEVAPWGKARIREEGNHALADFQINLGTARGREMREVLLFDLTHPPAKMEWSWAFTVPPDGAEMGELAGQRVRRLKKVLLHEVSTVIRGSSVGTRTLAVKEDLAARTAEVVAEYHRQRERGEQLMAKLLAADFEKLRREPGERPHGYKFLAVPRDDPKRGWAIKVLGVAAEALGLPTLKGIVTDVEFFTEEREQPDFRVGQKLMGGNFSFGVIGLHRDLDPGEMAATAAHEVLHRVRPKATESECNRFGERIAAKMLASPRPGGHWSYEQAAAAAMWVRAQGGRM